MPQFADYEPKKWKWVTVFDTGYYPDHFQASLELYRPVIDRFRGLASKARTSAQLLHMIQEERGPTRIQLLRIFRRYVSPATSVEMLKRKTDTEEICKAFGPLFRDIKQVQKHISRPDYDLTISALLYEYKDRGQLGYELAERFYRWFDSKFPNPPFEAIGSRRGRGDVELSQIFPDYPHRCPTDIIVKHKGRPLVVGFARYDSDRGGSQEDDRTGGNETKVLQIIEYAKNKRTQLAIFFLNDGPGLLLGSMWRDYATLEQIAPERVLVLTLQMLDTRFTETWLLNL